jgi:isoleucyl-tRNA synthetase
MYKKVSSWLDIVSVEKEIQKFWEENHIFRKLLEKNKNGKKWSFLDGPITANNPMGVHHAWGRTLKDVYQRYFALNERKLRYQNGFDCQGLWVEVEVEKELGFNSKKDIENYGIDKFVEKCKKRAMKFANIITRQSKRLGFWMDWENSYYTLSEENNYTIWEFLKKCHERGLIYKGHDVMTWCPRCETGISQHEVQDGYKETKHLSVVVLFPINNRENEAFLVWTTTPWTLTSNVAIAVNPNSVYLKVKQGKWIYYIIKSRAEIVLEEQGDWTVIEELTGNDIINFGFSYKGPFDELLAQKKAILHHKVIPWKNVTEKEGTGIVHIAPGCGSEDFILGKEFSLPIIAPINESGLFLDGFAWLTGKHASEIAEEIKQDLKKKNILYTSERYLHSYAHCWRCGRELLFRLVDEWFISMDPIREDIKNIAKKARWLPPFGLERELDWLTNMKDWMISKKRYWGLALPIWECLDCKSFTVIGSKKELKEKAIEGWEQFKGNSPHKPWIDKVKIECPQCGKIISRVTDVGNPWLDAGIVPYSTVKYNTDREYWKQWMPADLVLECFLGQFRGWFYSLLAMSTVMENAPSFTTLVGHALVLDENGEEMHKSKGNAIWFDDAAEDIGADVMRWIYCNQELSIPLNFGYKKAKLVRGKFFNTLWNCYAFFVNYARLIEFTPQKIHSDIQKRPDIDRWIVSKLQKLIKKCRNSFEAFDVRNACRNIDEFVELLSNWYIRNNRRRFWHSQLVEDTLYAYETLFECLNVVFKLLAPILPMTTEACYQNMIRSVVKDAPESIHLTSYPLVKNEIIDEQLVEDMDTIVKIYKLALSAREKAQIKIRQPLSSLIISPNNEREIRAVNRFSELLKEGLNVKGIDLLDIKVNCPIEIKIMPNKRSLGSTYKAESKLIIEEIEKQLLFITDKVKKCETEFEFNLKNGKEITISSADLIVDEVDPENLSIVKFDEGWIAFDIVLTEELLIEGLMRDLLRQMQVLRKDSGLEIEDRISVMYSTDSLNMKNAIKQYEHFLCRELLCERLEEKINLTIGKELVISEEKILVEINRIDSNSESFLIK